MPARSYGPDWSRADTSAPQADRCPKAPSYRRASTRPPVSQCCPPDLPVALQRDGSDLAPEHGRPARLLVPHLYLWKSAKWVPGLELRHSDVPGFREGAGYRNYGDPWPEQRETSGIGDSVHAGAERAGLARTPGGQHVDVRLPAGDGCSTPRSYSITFTPEDSLADMDRTYLRSRGINAVIPAKKDQSASRKKRDSEDGRLTGHHADLFKGSDTVER